jgi:NADH dehydrogenase
VRAGRRAGHPRGLRDAGVVRPAVMFGPDDAFLNTLVRLLRRLPIYPMFGRGTTRLQPADVEDVGEMIAKLMQRTVAEAITVECGGPRVYTYEELVRTIARAANVNRMLVQVPFAAWHAVAWVGELLPSAPVARNQVELMESIPWHRQTFALPTGLAAAVGEVLRSILQAPARSFDCRAPLTGIQDVWTGCVSQ